MVDTRQIVVPGEVVDDTGDLLPGMNTYQEGRNILALRLGVKAVKAGRVNVVSLSGRYEPYRGDMVIGTVVELGPSNWYIDIGAANDVGMHVNDVPWRVEFGETSKYMAIGDTVLLKIVHVDEMKKAQVSMKDRQCRKLSGGLILEVAPTKVPRIVGRNGSMIQLIKDATAVRIFVGQNGVVWLDGEPDDVQLALEALRKIEAEAHTTGLTDRMKAWLEERRPVESRPQRVVEEEPVEEAPAEERPRRAPRARPAEDEAPARFERREERGGERRERGGDRGDRPMRSRDERGRQFRGPEDTESDERPRAVPVDEERPRRAREDDRPRGPRDDDRPRGPRRFEDERPRGRREDDAPARPPRAEDRPRRRFDDEEEERPRRRVEADEAPRRPRFSDEAEERPRPRPRFAEEPADVPRRARRDDDENVRESPRPKPRAADDDNEDDDRPAPREGGSGGGDRRRRRRGGRGRGRGKED